MSVRLGCNRKLRLCPHGLKGHPPMKLWSPRSSRKKLNLNCMYYVPRLKLKSSCQVGDTNPTRSVLTSWQCGIWWIIQEGSWGTCDCKTSWTYVQAIMEYLDQFFGQTLWGCWSFGSCYEHTSDSNNSPVGILASVVTVTRGGSRSSSPFTIIYASASWSVSNLCHFGHAKLPCEFITLSLDVIIQVIVIYTKWMDLHLVRWTPVGDPITMA